MFPDEGDRLRFERGTLGSRGRIGAWVALRAAAIAAVVAGDVAAANLTIGLAAHPTSLDPHGAYSSANAGAIRHVFEPLVVQGHDQRLRPGLAYSWQNIDDKTWEFKLRSYVRFHDGRPMTSADVVFSFRRFRVRGLAAGPKNFGSWLAGLDMTAVDPVTVRVKSTGPRPLVPRLMSLLSVVSRAAAAGAREEDFTKARFAVGTGPYKLVRFDRDGQVELERDEGYWGNKPEWTRVTLRGFPSISRRMSTLLEGEVDLVEAVPPGLVGRLRADPAFTVSQGISGRVIYLQLDQFRSVSPYVTSTDGSIIENPLRDRRIRRAIAVAIDRHALTANVLAGSAVLAGQLVPPDYPGASRRLRPVDFDRRESNHLLTAARLREGFKLTVHAPAGRYLGDVGIAQSVARMLTEAGIEARAQAVPSGEYFARASRGGSQGVPEFSVMLLGWRPATGEAGTTLAWLLHSFDPGRGLGLANRGRYRNAEVDRRIEEALVTLDDSRRRALLVEANEIAMDDLAVIPLYFEISTWAGRKGLRYRARTDEMTLAAGVYTE